jgi:hypothetical protein
MIVQLFCVFMLLNQAGLKRKKIAFLSSTFSDCRDYQHAVKHICRLCLLLEEGTEGGTPVLFSLCCSSCPILPVLSVLS